MQIVLIARIVSIAVFVFLGGLFHYNIFAKDSYIDSIIAYPYMFIIYIILSLLAGEHFLNFLKRKKK